MFLQVRCVSYEGVNKSMEGKSYAQTPGKLLLQSQGRKEDWNDVLVFLYIIFIKFLNKQIYQSKRRKQMHNLSSIIIK